MAVLCSAQKKKIQVRPPSEFSLGSAPVHFNYIYRISVWDRQKSYIWIKKINKQKPTTTKIIHWPSFIKEIGSFVQHVTWLFVLQWVSRLPSFLRQIALWWAGRSSHSLHLRLGPEINYSPMHRQKQCWRGKIPPLFSLQLTPWVLQKHETVIVFLKNEITELRGLSFLHNDRILGFRLYLA